MTILVTLDQPNPTLELQVTTKLIGFISSLQKLILPHQLILQYCLIHIRDKLSGNIVCMRIELLGDILNIRVILGSYIYIIGLYPLCLDIVLYYT